MWYCQYLLCTYMLTQVFDHLPITRDFQSCFILQKDVRIASQQVKLSTLNVVQNLCMVPCTCIHYMLSCPLSHAYAISCIRGQTCIHECHCRQPQFASATKCCKKHMQHVVIVIALTHDRRWAQQSALTLTKNPSPGIFGSAPQDSSFFTTSR